MTEIVLRDDNIEEVAEATGFPVPAVENLLNDFKDRGVYPIHMPDDPVHEDPGPVEEFEWFSTNTSGS